MTLADESIAYRQRLTQHMRSQDSFNRSALAVTWLDFGFAFGASVVSL